jgi:hypothetical protein
VKDTRLQQVVLRELGVARASVRKEDENWVETNCFRKNNATKGP